MIRLKDVARQAGVSITTVSHVVNDTRRVAPDTLERVQRAIAELGYRPDSVARTLKSNRSHTIGMIVTTAHNPFFSEIIRGVEDHCFANGYSLVLCNADDVENKQLAYLQTLLDRRIDGLIVMTSRNGPAFLEALRRQGLPTILMDADPEPGQDVGVVNDDSPLGARLAIEHLLAQGFEDIALLTGPEDHPRSRERLAGALATLTAAGIDTPAERIVTTNLLAGGGFDAMQALLENRPRPQAVFAFNDLVAIGAIRAIHEWGMRIPDDLSVIGYDDIELARYLTPSLTTIHQPIYELGATAIAQLIERLEHGRPLDSIRSLAPRLVIRESVESRRHRDSDIGDTNLTG
ncbi:transcriptional regulator, LacI family [Modicisalibacter ilicicola DSM 19980]|uniref:Transcriptional regulator, LacI family n=1 Tax=Modicisalibacter ilicicola DSM 19980 TaxID=1121942 RepID=A0A1M5EWC2_9GAMM|nr:LacI family DNA-binding transcriptional regulator [Halomonas ilicicola]SHF83426.1 transcriptional regulator, LacI family [Halomonas ilicicola DSM 19980]